MEATIKQAEDERNKMLEHAKQLYGEQVMVKEQVDMVRTSIGLEPIPDKMSEGDAKLFYRLDVDMLEDLMIMLLIFDVLIKEICKNAIVIV